jgi:hypothetical protein
MPAIPMLKEKTWYVLKDSIPASRVDQLLGSIVQDFRDPTAGYLPTTAQPRQLVPAIADLVETRDLEARVEVEKIRSSALSAQLFEVLTGGHSRSREANLVLESSSIHTRKLVNHAKPFADLIAQPTVRTELEAALKQGGKRKLYFVVGIKTCSRSHFSSTTSRKNESSFGGAVPLDAMAGIPGLLPVANVGASITLSSGTTTGTSATLLDDRIFALEYRVARRDWFGYGSQPKLGDKLDGNDGGNFFGNEEDSDAESEDEDGVESLGLVDSQHTPTCLLEDGAQVDGGSGYIFS